MATHDDVCRAYFDGYGPSKGHNVFRDSKGLWSYGHHFWLAKYNPHSGRYLINGDYYSMSTRKHQNYTQRHAPASALTVSAGALEYFGLEPDTLEVIDTTPDTQEHFTMPDEANGADWASLVDIATEAAQEFIASAPPGATVFYKTMHQPDGDDTLTLPDYYHRAGSAVMKRPEATHRRWIRTGTDIYDGEYQDVVEPAAWFLMGQDENQYFIAQLPRAARSVPDAFTALQPRQVRKAIAQGLDVKRQGEWFFIPVIGPGKDARAVYKQLGRNYDLTDASGNDGSAHIATRGGQALDVIFNAPVKPAGWILKHNDFLVSGMIRHSAREHAMLKLSYSKDPVIFAAFRNTALDARSMGGNVD